MVITTAQWNIGGGKIRIPGSNPELEQSYSVNGISEITKTLVKTPVDILALQETHADSKTNQAEVIAHNLDLPYYFNDAYKKSHLEPGQRLGQAILSRFPIENHAFTLFPNPKFQMMRPDGELWTTHDKGLSSCTITLPDGTALTMMSLHLIPFHRFGIDPLGPEASSVRKDVVGKIRQNEQDNRLILLGDFNFDNDSLSSFLPEVFDLGMQEVPRAQVTTPKEKKYDHALYRGISLVKSHIDLSALTDHYPIFSTFETN